jgi:hypothetical protein
VDVKTTCVGEEEAVVVGDRVPVGAPDRVAAARIRIATATTARQATITVNEIHSHFIPFMAPKSNGRELRETLVRRNVVFGFSRG